MSSSLVAPTRGAEQTIYCFRLGALLDILMRSVDGVAGLEITIVFQPFSTSAVIELGQSGRRGTGDRAQPIAESDRQDSLPLVKLAGRLGVWRHQYSERDCFKSLVVVIF